MKCRVEARDLRYVGITALQRFNEFDLARQVLGIERCNAAQLRQQRPRHALGLGVQHAMHHAVADGIGNR